MSSSNYYYYKKKINTSKVIKDIIVIYIITIITVLFFNSSLFQAYKVPSQSMSPALEENTRIIVDKFSIGPKILFTNKRIFDGSSKNLNRGDIIVFMSNEFYKKNIFFRTMSTFIHTITFSLVDFNNILFKYDTNVYVKRIIGLPGDHISFRMLNNNTIIVLINGIHEKEVILNPYTLIEENKNNSKLLNALLIEKEIIIPENEFYLLGDNRINSADSRIYGTIHKNQVIGKVIFTYWPWEKIGLTQ